MNDSNFSSQQRTIFTCIYITIHFSCFNCPDHIWVQFLHHGGVGFHHSTTRNGVISLAKGIRTLEKLVSDSKIILSCRAIVQVLCSYSTLPLYALVSQVNWHKFSYYIETYCQYSSITFTISVSRHRWGISSSKQFSMSSRKDL